MHEYSTRVTSLLNDTEGKYLMVPLYTLSVFLKIMWRDKLLMCSSVLVNVKQSSEVLHLAAHVIIHTSIVISSREVNQINSVDASVRDSHWAACGREKYIRENQLLYFHDLFVILITRMH